MCDKDGLEFWKNQLNDNSTLFELSLNGKLFKSHDDFIPKCEQTIYDMYIEAEKYWNPKFTEDLDSSKFEYLFQGKAKVLKRL